MPTKVALGIAVLVACGGALFLLQSSGDDNAVDDQANGSVVDRPADHQQTEPTPFEEPNCPIVQGAGNHVINAQCDPWGSTLVEDPGGGEPATVFAATAKIGESSVNLLLLTGHARMRCLRFQTGPGVIYTAIDDGCPLAVGGTDVPVEPVGSECGLEIFALPSEGASLVGLFAFDRIDLVGIELVLVDDTTADPTSLLTYLSDDKPCTFGLVDVFDAYDGSDPDG